MRLKLDPQKLITIGAKAWNQADQETRQRWREHLESDEIDPESYTCNGCEVVQSCHWAYFTYNTNGICLAKKKPSSSGGVT